MDVFNDKIKPLFDSSGMTDKEIETALGLPRGVIYKWKSGKYKSYKDYLSQISNYFHVSIDYLMGIDTTKSLVEAEGIKKAPDPKTEGARWDNDEDFKEAVALLKKMDKETLRVFVKAARGAVGEQS